MCQQIVCLLIAFCIALAPCQGGRYLFYMPYGTRSMKITFMPVVEELGRRGHEVTVVMPYPADSKTLPPSVRVIQVENTFAETEEQMSDQLLTVMTTSYFS